MDLFSNEPDLFDLPYEEVKAMAEKCTKCQLAKGRTKTFSLNKFALELTPLAINVVVLVVTECLGYIHATSLRWALFYEGKLEFNTNLRLLSHSTSRSPAVDTRSLSKTSLSKTSCSGAA